MKNTLFCFGNRCATIGVAAELRSRRSGLRFTAEARAFFSFPKCPDRLLGPPSFLFTGSAAVPLLFRMPSWRRVRQLDVFLYLYVFPLKKYFRLWRDKNESIFLFTNLILFFQFSFLRKRTYSCKCVAKWNSSALQCKLHCLGRDKWNELCLYSHLIHGSFSVFTFVSKRPYVQ